MKTKPFIPRTDADKDLWLKNFANKLPYYSGKYSIADIDVTDMVESALHFSYWLNYKNQFEDYARKLTAYKNEARDGVPAGATPSIVPQPPKVDAPPKEVSAGIFVRASSIGVRIKKHQLATDADVKDLGLIGEEIAIDSINAQPTISIRLIQGGKPEIVWTKSNYDAIEIWVDRGAGSNFLTIDAHPNYTDNAPLPTTGQSQIWKYKAIYLLNDERIGQWSSEHSVSVHSA